MRLSFQRSLLQGHESKGLPSSLDRELNEINVIASFLKEDSSDGYKKLSKLTKALSLGPLWGNARDVKSLWKTTINKLFKGYF